MDWGAAVGMFFVCLGSGWFVIVVAVGTAEDAVGCGVAVLGFWALYLLGVLLQHPVAGILAYIGLGLGVWLGVATVEGKARTSQGP